MAILAGGVIVVDVTPTRRKLPFCPLQKCCFFCSRHNLFDRQTELTDKNNRVGTDDTVGRAENVLN